MYFHFGIILQLSITFISFIHMKLIKHT